MKFHFILLAAGFSRRFGENKLLMPYQGKPFYLHTVEKLSKVAKRPDVDSFLVVTRYDEILNSMREMGIACVLNDHSEEGISSSLKVGLEQTQKLFRSAVQGNGEAYVFFVSDQPKLSIDTIQSLLDDYVKNPFGISCASTRGKPGNPVIFSAQYYTELMALSGDVGGKQIMKKHPEAVRRMPVPEEELFDIDRPEDLKK